MKINSSINLQNNNWKDTAKHINRDYIHDSNQDIDLRLSHYNLSTDGHYRHGHFVKNKSSYNKRERLLKDAIVKHYSKWIHQHNKTAKRQHHSKRIIKNPVKYFIGTSGSTKRNKVERTFSEPVSHVNYMASIIMHHQHISRHQANKSLVRQLSKALYKNDLDLSKRFPHLYISHYGTNVDERKYPGSPFMDSVHAQGAIIGLSWTKIQPSGNLTPDKRVSYKSGKRKGKLHLKRGSRPSISVDRALCEDTGVKYSRKTKSVRRGNKSIRINASVAKALSNFNDTEGRSVVHSVQHQLYNHYHYTEFKHLSFSRTNSKQTGLSQIEYQRKAHREAKQRKLKQHQEKVRRRHIRQAKARNRRYHRVYQRTWRAKNKYHQLFKKYLTLKPKIKKKNKIINKKIDTITTLEVEIQKAKKERGRIYKDTSYKHMLKLIFANGYRNRKHTQDVYNKHQENRGLKPQKLSTASIIKMNVKHAVHLAKVRNKARTRANNRVVNLQHRQNNGISRN